VKPGRFDYHRPTSLAEALDLLARYGDEAKVLAGGQSLVPLLSMRMARPAVVVDINHVADLDNSRRRDSPWRVGALVRQASFAGVSRLGDRCLPHVGHVVTRNRGTVAGSIAHADASAELPLALLTTGGAVVAASAAGTREIPAEDFFVTHFTTVLEPSELVVETRWPDGWDTEGGGVGFAEFALRSGDYALAMAACVLRAEHGMVAEARIAVGSVADRPALLPEAGALLRGREVTVDAAREAGEAARAAVDPPDGLHASGAYRRHLTALMVERAVLDAWRDAARRPDASGGER
jgi:CO/xanthine dehydrogenase FAD-binding subunit